MITANERMADYLGWGKFGNVYQTPFDNASISNGEETHLCPAYRMKFDTSWDWLMLVAQKIKEENEFLIIDEVDRKKWRLLGELRELTLGCNIDQAFNRINNYLMYTMCEAGDDEGI